MTETIDTDEEAAIIVGLGRGGRGYYLFNVNRFDGVPTDDHNPPRPLLADESTGFRNLRDTWAAPWTGFMEVAPGEQRTVAIFPSGHVPELDAASAPFASLPTAAPLASNDIESTPFQVACADLGIPADVCETPDANAFCADLGLSCSSGGSCDPCTFTDDADCRLAGLQSAVLLRLARSCRAAYIAKPLGSKPRRLGGGAFPLRLRGPRGPCL